MDIKRKVGSPDSQGNAAAEYSSYLRRSCDWQYGRDAQYQDIVSEAKEEDLKFGVVNPTPPPEQK